MHAQNIETQKVYLRKSSESFDTAQSQLGLTEKYSVNSTICSWCRELKCAGNSKETGLRSSSALGI